MCACRRTRRAPANAIPVRFDSCQARCSRALTRAAMRAKAQTVPVGLLELASLVAIEEEVAPCRSAGQRPRLAKLDHASSRHTGDTEREVCPLKASASAVSSLPQLVGTRRFASHRRRSPSHDNTAQSPDTCLISDNVGGIFFRCVAKVRRARRQSPRPRTCRGWPAKAARLGSVAARSVWRGAWAHRTTAPP